jgi:hypothetical protein
MLAFRAMELVSTNNAKPQQTDHLFMGPLLGVVIAREESIAVHCHQEGIFL